MTAPAKAQIVIPVHNRRETTHACLERLNQLGIPTWAGVIVVDDGSTDGTAEMIQAEHPWVQRLHGHGQLWWTGAIDLGMREAIRNGAECIVWLNDDVLPDAGALELLVEEALMNQSVCGAVCRGGNEIPVAYAGGVMRNLWPHPVRHIQGTAPIPVEWLHGNLVAVPAVVWRRCGLPQARHMPHNLADISYTLDAHRAGIPVRLLPGATALATPNDTASYWSWTDPRIRPWNLLKGLWNVKMWWYLPGVAWFQAHHSGWRAAPVLAFLILKLLLWILLKSLLPARALKQLNTIIGCKSARQ